MALANGNGKAPNLEQIRPSIRYGYLIGDHAESWTITLTLTQVTVGDVKDGKPSLAYDPPSIDAQPGDYVQFNFKAQNHTVTQSTFDKPCVKMPGGMDSGFMPNPNNTMPVPPAMMVAINDTKPICKSSTLPDAKVSLWLICYFLGFYCRQATHCGKGMAFGINPGSTDKMMQFMNNAKSQNGTAANGTANGLSASNSTSAGNGTASGQNGLPASAAVASPSAAPLSNLVPGSGQMSAGGSDSGAMDTCTCNCLCDLGTPGMGGLIGSIPLPSTGAMGSKRSVRF